MSMIKLFCFLLGLLLTLTIFFSNPAESRAVHQDLNGRPAAHLQALRLDDGRRFDTNQNDDEQNEYILKKRKSDFLLSLYGLPYSLVNQGDLN